MSATGAVFGVYLVLLAFWVLVSWYVGSHASKRGYSGIGWGVATFLFGIAAVLIYFILVAPNSERQY